MDDAITAQAIALYQQIDQQTTALQQATGLTCPPGCGRCCETPDISVAVVDMRAIAQELVRRGEAAAWLARLETVASQSRCVFYQANPNQPGQGSCQMYTWRPTICRLFGYATSLNKWEQPELLACRHLRQTQPQVVSQTQAAIQAGLAAPDFRYYLLQLASLDPQGSQLLPINQALQLALQQAGLRLQFAANQATGNGE